jgi:hypothetical protein
MGTPSGGSSRRGWAGFQRQVVAKGAGHDLSAAIGGARLAPCSTRWKRPAAVVEISAMGAKFTTISLTTIADLDIFFNVKPAG